jgi:hypothetical protein
MAALSTLWRRLRRNWLEIYRYFLFGQRFLHVKPALSPGPKPKILATACNGERWNAPGFSSLRLPPRVLKARG